MTKRRKHGGGRRRAATGAETPERTCVACRETAPKEGLLRFVRAPDGGVGFDVRARMDGRGAWTCPRPECIERAVERGGFARAFSAPVLVSSDLVADVRAALLHDVLNGLSLLRRQSLLWPGRTEASKRFATGEAAHVVAAHDLSARSSRELAELLGPEAVVLPGPSKEAIGRALGRRETGVVGFASGPLAGRVVRDLERWARCTTAGDGDGQGAGAPLRSQVAGV